MESVDNSTPDLISNIPSHLIENILVCLPLKDAAKTSVLSKKWLNAWETLPQLVFDLFFGAGLSPSQLSLLIHRILLTHRGPIFKFELSTGIEGSGDIHRIIKFLSRNGIQDLTLKIFWRDERYRLPSYLFSCTELTYLHLQKCLLEPPATFDGLKNLVTLKFRNVFFEPSVIENFFSRFPLLESLTLEWCRDIQHLSIPTPMLKYLKLESAFKSISFSNTGQLKTAFIGSLGNKRPNVDDGFRGSVSMVELFDSFSGTIEYLNLGCYFWKILDAEYVPSILVTEFSCLKTIKFEDISFQVNAELQNAMYIISSSPNLRHLSIRLFRGQNSDVDKDGGVEILKAHGQAEFFYELQTVEIKYCKGTEPEMEFVKVTLARSPSLETMRIQIDQTIETGEQLRIVKQITLFRRASTTAVVECV